jgi:hypothetical protein
MGTHQRTNSDFPPQTKYSMPFPAKQEIRVEPVQTGPHSA